MKNLYLLLLADSKRRLIDNHYYAIANKASLTLPKDLNPPEEKQVTTDLCSSVPGANTNTFAFALASKPLALFIEYIRDPICMC